MLRRTTSLRSTRTVPALLCFVVVYGLILPMYPSGLHFLWNRGRLTSNNTKLDAFNGISHANLFPLSAPQRFISTIYFAPWNMHTAVSHFVLLWAYFEFEVHSDYMFTHIGSACEVILEIGLISTSIKSQQNSVNCHIVWERKNSCYQQDDYEWYQ